jgi:hypothetical protein
MSYLDDLGREIRAHVAPELLPSDDVDTLFRLYALLALAKGEAVTAEDVHNAWSAWMQDRDPDHDALRPFDELDGPTQAADEPYVEAIRAAARECGP